MKRMLEPVSGDRRSFSRKKKEDLEVDVLTLGALQRNSNANVREVFLRVAVRACPSAFSLRVGLFRPIPHAEASAKPILPPDTEGWKQHE